MVQSVNMETAANVADTLQSLMERADGTPIMHHDPTRDGELDPGPQQMRVRNSMVRMGGKQLPERFDAYDKWGNLHRLPTAMMTAMLQKPRADAPNERAFHTHTRGVTRESCAICPEPKERWQGACEFCPPGSGKAAVGSFPSENDCIVHKRRLHPEEHEAQERMLERADRRGLLEAQERLAEAMMRQTTSAPVAATALYPCEEDGCDHAPFATAHGLSVHEAKAHKALREEAS